MLIGNIPESIPRLNSISNIFTCILLGVEGEVVSLGVGAFWSNNFCPIFKKI